MGSELFTAAEFAAKAGCKAQYVRKVLGDRVASGEKIVRGATAAAWSIGSLPSPFLQRLVREASRHRFAAPLDYMQSRATPPSGKKFSASDCAASSFSTTERSAASPEQARSKKNLRRSGGWISSAEQKMSSAFSVSSTVMVLKVTAFRLGFFRLKIFVGRHAATCSC